MEACPFHRQAQPKTAGQSGTWIDIDADGKNELLVGYTGTTDNVRVFRVENTAYAAMSIPRYSVKMVANISLGSSSIPGFMVGDVDNDQKNEMLYNHMYVLKFSRDYSGNLQHTIIDQLRQRPAIGAQIGLFVPTGVDIPVGFRVIPSLNFAFQNEYFESGHSYQCWITITNIFGSAKNVHVQLSSEDGYVEVKNKQIDVGNMTSGQTYSSET